MKNLGFNKEQMKEFLIKTGYYEHKDGKGLCCQKCWNEGFHNDSGYCDTSEFITTDFAIVDLFHCDDCGAVTFFITEN